MTVAFNSYPAKVIFGGGPGRVDPEGKAEPLIADGKAPLSSCVKSKASIIWISIHFKSLLYLPPPTPDIDKNDFLLEVYTTIPLRQHPGLIITIVLLTPERVPAKGFSRSERSPAPVTSPTRPQDALGRESLTVVKDWKQAKDSGPSHLQANKQFTRPSVGCPVLLQWTSFSLLWTTNSEINLITYFYKLNMFFDYYYVLSLTQEILTFEISLATITFSSNHKKFCNQF